MSNEKITKQLNEHNEWLDYLKTGKKGKPALKIKKHKPSHALFISGKQRRSFKSGETDPVFVGSLTSKQRNKLRG